MVNMPIMDLTAEVPDTNGYPPTLLAALAVLQGDLPQVAKDQTAKIEKEGKTPYSYKYAKLEEISPLLLPKLSKVGLSWSSMLGFDEKERWGLHFELAHHPSGDKKIGFWPINLNLGPQQIGSMLTYADRYALCKATGLAPGEGSGTDDDGAAAQRAWQAEQDAKPSEVEIGRWIGEQIDKVFAMDNPAWIESGGKVILADVHKRGERDVKGLVTAADRKVLGAEPNAVLTLNDVIALVQGYVESTGKPVRAPKDLGLGTSEPPPEKPDPDATPYDDPEQPAEPVESPLAVQADADQDALDRLGNPEREQDSPEVQPKP